MFRLLTLSIYMLLSLLFLTNWSSAEGPWILEWWTLDAVSNNGGIANGINTDWIAAGTDYDSECELTELENVPGPDDVVERDNDELHWSVRSLGNVNSSNNMGISYGQPGGVDNTTWHGMIIVTSPTERDTTFHVSYDDDCHVCLNGELVYNASGWTGGPLNTKPVDVHLRKGENVLLVKVSEGGGGDYVNARFDDNDLDYNPEDGKFKLPGHAVSPSGKLAIMWGGVKTSY